MAIDDVDPSSNRGLVSAKQLKLRRELQLHRQEIERRIEPEHDGHNGFPSSTTMRFLLEHRLFIIRLLLESLVLLIGSRLLKSVSLPALLVRFLYPVVMKSLHRPDQKGLPAPHSVTRQN